MDELRKYAVFALKGVLSVPLLLAAGQANVRYNNAVADPRTFTDRERFSEVDAAAGEVLQATELFGDLWGIERPLGPPSRS